MSVRIYHIIIVAPDLPKDEEEAVVGGRAITYFELPGFGDLIVDINGWDKKVLENIRAHPKIAGLNGKPADQAYTRQELVRSEERRVGKGCVSTCRSRWSPFN